MQPTGPSRERPDYAQALKRLLTRAHDGVLALLAPELTWRGERSSELPAVARRADPVWEVVAGALAQPRGQAGERLDGAWWQRVPRVEKLRERAGVHAGLVRLLVNSVGRQAAQRRKATHRAAGEVVALAVAQVGDMEQRAIGMRIVAEGTLQDSARVLGGLGQGEDGCAVNGPHGAYVPRMR